MRNTFELKLRGMLFVFCANINLHSQTATFGRPSSLRVFLDLER